MKTIYQQLMKSTNTRFVFSTEFDFFSILYASNTQINQFVFDLSHENEFAEKIDDWLEYNLPGKYTFNIHEFPMKFMNIKNTYKILDFGEDTESATLFKLFHG